MLNIPIPPHVQRITIITTIANNISKLHTDNNAPPQDGGSSGSRAWGISYILSDVATPWTLGYAHQLSTTIYPYMVRSAGLRWTIEAGFESAKREVSLDHYEVRQWISWYRRITLALIAHAFLAVIMAQSAPAGKIES